MSWAGVPALDKLFKGIPAGKNIQLVGLDSGKMTEIALNMVKHAKSSIIFNMNGMLNKEMAVKLTTTPEKDVLVHDILDNPADSMEILHLMVMKRTVDLIVVDDIPSIVSRAERLGVDGGELESLELIGKTMLKIKAGCLKKGITVIWINHIRADEIYGLRIWGGNYISSKMQMTLLCESRRLISRGEHLKGTEIGIRVYQAKSEFVRRRTHVGIFLDGSIDYPYWVFQEALRYRVIVYTLVGKNKDRHGFVYDGKSYYDRWKIIDRIEKDDNFKNKLLEEIDDEETRKNFY